MDRIIYTQVTVGGGVDGRDPSDKGGAVVFASFDKQVVTEKIGANSIYRLGKEVVDTDEVYGAILKRLSVVERLIVNERNKVTTR